MSIRNHGAAGGSHERPSGFGCPAFGHLAGPFVDGELARTEAERFATHLEACAPCQLLGSEYRAIDVLARSEVPVVTDAAWDAAWSSIAAAVAQDRKALESAPLAGVLRWQRTGSRLSQGRPWLRPLAYAAAAAVVASLLLTLRRPVSQAEVATLTPPVRPTAAATKIAAADPGQVVSLTCQSPDFVPVVYTTDGDDPMTVVQCAWIGAESPASGPGGEG